MSDNIKDVEYEDSSAEILREAPMGHSSFPQNPHPGYDVDYPTCSKPNSSGNMGCDAFAKCTTPGEGPYMVAFTNKAGRKEFTHCRNWMYKLQFKHGYTALGQDPEDAWEDQIMEEPVNPDDKSKGVRTKRQKMKVENVRWPRPFRERPQAKQPPQVKEVEVSEPVKREGIQEGITHGNRGTDNQSQEAGTEGSVGSKGDRKGRSRSKGHDEGSV